MSDSRKRPSGPGAPRAKKTHTSDETRKLPTDKIAEFNRVRQGLLQMLRCAAMAVEVAEFNAIRKQMMEKLACVECGVANCDDLDDEDTTWPISI